MIKNPPFCNLKISSGKRGKGRINKRTKAVSHTIHGLGPRCGVRHLRQLLWLELVSNKGAHGAGHGAFPGYHFGTSRSPLAIQTGLCDPKAGVAFDYARRALGKDVGFCGGMAQNIELYLHLRRSLLALARISISFSGPAHYCHRYTGLHYFLSLNVYGVKVAATFEWALPWWQLWR